jgi:CHAD domain-containing protein
MMTPENFIILNWNKQQSVFLANLQEIRKKPTKKSIHDLRVSVKKLRSFLRLSELISGQKWRAPFTQVKTLFKISGKLRDFELSITLLSDYTKKENSQLPSLIKYLKVNKSLTSQWTKKAALAFHEDQLQILSGILQTSIAEISNEDLMSKINEMTELYLKKINLLANDFNKNLHEIRKILKEIYYWLNSCPYNPNNNFDNTILEEILQDLGCWQDNFVFLNKVKNFRKEFLAKNTIETAGVKTLEIKIRNKKDELLNKVKKDIQLYILKQGKE